MSHPELSEATFGTYGRRTRPSFRARFRRRFSEASAYARACTLLTVAWTLSTSGACTIDTRSPGVAAASETPGSADNPVRSGNGSPANAGVNDLTTNANTSATSNGSQTRGSQTEGTPGLVDIAPGDRMSGAAPAGSAPVESAPTEGATEPAAVTDSDQSPPAQSEPVIRPEGPCDIYAAANIPCVGAYSLVRALSIGYSGPLYQVRRGAAYQNTGTGGETQDIGILPNGFADTAVQFAFCENQACTVSALYDQSGRGNHLTVAKAGCSGCDLNPPALSCRDDFESTATGTFLLVGGNAVYGLHMESGEGYRNNDAVNTPEGEEQAGIYMVAAGSGSRPSISQLCCWDFGIASRDNCDGATGETNALFFGAGRWGGGAGSGAGSGPWFMGDFEGGVWAGGTAGRFANEIAGEPGESWPLNLSNPSMTMDFAFGILKSGPGNYALRMGDAQQGILTTAYDGPTPTVLIRWQMGGSIILGIGGDNTNSGRGTFFEGAIVAGRPSNSLDDAILQNVQAAGYGR
jgi:hypothetical protein